MAHGRETERFEELLRRRGVLEAAHPEVEREILERYQDHCAILVLDSSGFTRATQEKGVILFLALTVAMRDLAAPIFEANEALAHWHYTDNLYGVFPTAWRAVKCALDLQRSVQVANARRPAGSRLEVCIGIGWGKLLRIGTEDIHGDQMNLACKLGEDIARPRQILLTEAAYEEVHRLKAAGGLRFERRRLRISGVQLVHYSIRPPR